MEVTKVMDELQRLLSGSAIGLEHSRHEDGAVGVALAELLPPQRAASGRATADAWTHVWHRQLSGVPMVGYRRHKDG